MLRQVLSPLDVAAIVAPLNFALSCAAEQFFSGSRAKLIAPGLYFILLPLLCGLGCFIACGILVYVVVPLGAKCGVAFNQAAKKRQLALKGLGQAISPELRRLQLEFADLLATGLIDDTGLLLRD